MSLLDCPYLSLLCVKNLKTLENEMDDFFYDYIEDYNDRIEPEDVDIPGSLDGEKARTRTRRLTLKQRSGLKGFSRRRAAAKQKPRCTYFIG